MISTFTVFFDSNAFFGARLRSLVIEAAQSGLFRARWSEDVHREWISAVAAKRPDIELKSLERVQILMDAAVPGCITTGYEQLVASLTLPDPDDRHVLAAAIVAKASVIVTFNEKDFPQASLAPFGLHTRHPDDFFLDIESLDSAMFVDIVANDLAHYCEPPLTINAYCEALTKAGIPNTASKIEQLAILFEPPVTK
jgi:predicted nucleic acid-binding protein